jgi:hypothetical protein
LENLLELTIPTALLLPPDVSLVHKQGKVIVCVLHAQFGVGVQQLMQLLMVRLAQRNEVEELLHAEPGIAAVVEDKLSRAAHKTVLGIIGLAITLFHALPMPRVFIVL